jgi:hypothetical protein
MGSRPTSPRPFNGRDPTRAFGGARASRQVPPAVIRSSAIPLRRRIATVALITGGIVAPGFALRAQTGGMAMEDSARRATVAVRAQALGLVTRVDPAVGGRTHVEGYLAQPVIMAHGGVLNGHIGAVLTLDFEGLTLDRGQLNPGANGEGYSDRRHPHTYLHEAIVTASGTFRGIAVSLAGGKGFVPFGTDDPMMRPFAAYPVNHHLAQILERYVAIGAVKRGAVMLEGAFFNGDEPVSAGVPPDAGRFGDSWAARATVAPLATLELEASFASVTSPELATGGGLDQHKWSVGVRFDRDRGPLRAALVEWARSDDRFGEITTNEFTSFLAEATTAVRTVSLSARFENTTRPEEERLLDPFRYSRNPTDLGIIGITRWHLGSVALAGPLPVRRADVAPFVEVTYARPSEELRPSAFVPRDFYGASALWSMSFGVRVGVGRMSHRMGRYGVAMPNAAPPATSGAPHVH